MCGLRSYNKNSQISDCLVPALAGLGDDISSNVGNVLVSEAASESGHSSLSVGNLGDNSLLLEAAGKELCEV